MIHLRICEFEIFQCHPKNWANKISKHSKDAKISGIFLLVCTFHHLADVENTSFDDALNRLDLAEGQNLDVFVMLLFPIFFDAFFSEIILFQKVPFPKASFFQKNLFPKVCFSKSKTGID